MKGITIERGKRCKERNDERRNDESARRMMREKTKGEGRNKERKG